MLTPELLVAIAGPLATLAAGLFATALGFRQYSRTKREEFRQRFWDQQHVLYSRASDTAATIALASDLHSVEAERIKFWRLYWGPLSMVEHQSVESAMKNFGTILGEIESGDRPITKSQRGDEPNDIRLAAYDLAHAMRDSLAKTWQPIDLADVALEADKR